MTNPSPVPKAEKALFAGGCFWCTEAAFEGIDGVIHTTSGYTGGHLETPSYRDVSSGMSGHYEAVEVLYDPESVSYKDLLEVFWKSIDPMDSRGQFADRGSQYQTAIFYFNDAQYQEAVASKKAIESRLGVTVSTQILKASRFYPAEEGHQNFYEKNPLRYQQYKTGSGRTKRLHEIWGPSNGE
jgi:methionine-S-sulfoxide reductase